jgi:hypothetical protein
MMDLFEMIDEVTAALGQAGVHDEPAREVIEGPRRARFILARTLALKGAGPPGL